MSDQSKLLTGIILGAGTMYLLDPDRGTRRRALLRDRGAHLVHRTGRNLGATTRDLTRRSRGAVAEARSRFRGDEAGDDIIVQRVRAELGRIVSHPRAVRVESHEGRVTLSGPVLHEEAEPLLARVRAVRGVTDVIDELEVHAEAGAVPSLQGGRTRTQRAEWPGSVRLIAGALGGAIALHGLRSSGRSGRPLALVGGALLARAIGTDGPARLIGAGSAIPPIEVRKTVRIDAPIEEVWALWSDFENFPRFMSHLRQVVRTGEWSSHWVAAGPAGVPAEWDAITTEWVPHEAISWRSVAGSPVENEGTVRFRREGDRRTVVDIHLAYLPPAGRLGHAVAALFGTDPRHALNDDLVRLKSLLEDGQTTAAGGRVRLADVRPTDGGER